MGGQTQIRFLSPYALSTLATLGQNLASFIHVRGYTAFSREYGCFHVSEMTDLAVWGAFLITLSSLSAFPEMISSISFRMDIIAEQKRSSSSLLSLSVGSTIRVSWTGKATVGA